MKALFPLILLLAIEVGPAINQFNSIHAKFGSNLEQITPSVDKIASEVDVDKINPYFQAHSANAKSAASSYWY